MAAAASSIDAGAIGDLFPSHRHRNLQRRRQAAAERLVVVCCRAELMVEVPKADQSELTRRIEPAEHIRERH